LEQLRTLEGARVRLAHEPWRVREIARAYGRMVMKRTFLLRRPHESDVKEVRLRGSILSAAMLVAVLVSNYAAASPAVCNMRLSVELTPDIPNPRDSGFLSSLLSNQASYRLTLLGSRAGSVIVIELAGPGPEYLCQNVVEAMRKDGRVLSIHLEDESSS
jgi:hypothetical protein